MILSRKELLHLTCSLLFQFLFAINNSGQVLHVGIGFPYVTLENAIAEVVPGDTILVHGGTYSGGIFAGDLQGLPDAWIYILAATGETVIFEGGNNAWQFSDAAYLYISGFIFEHQLGNGVNFDDGGTYETPAHHVIFESCIFRDMNASGNNDLLKLSGLDSFQIRNCLFRNGALGGSGIDMVGCHDGLIKNNHFEDLGSNSIQAKGGTRNIRIEANVFKNGGARAVNLGGSTGLQFFRPIDAAYEAAELKVYSNIFIGSEAPIAFVGSINCEVINNTIYLPTKWVFRILQETVDPDRFPPCGYNTLRNNIIYIDDRVNVEVNIGPNTASETFTMSDNLWFHSEDAGWPGPDLPVEDVDNIVGEDPLFVKGESEDFHLLETSPAIGAGYDVVDPEMDYDGEAFLAQRSIGAYEGGMATKVEDISEDGLEGLFDWLRVWPNPASEILNIQWFDHQESPDWIRMIDMSGHLVLSQNKNSGNTVFVDLNELHRGVYILMVNSNSFNKVQKIILQ